MGMHELEMPHSDCKAAVVHAAVGEGTPAVLDLMQLPGLLLSCSLPWHLVPQKAGAHSHAQSKASVHQTEAATEDEPPVVSSHLVGQPKIHVCQTAVLRTEEGQCRQMAVRVERLAVFQQERAEPY